MSQRTNSQHEPSQFGPADAPKEQVTVRDFVSAGAGLVANGAGRVSDRLAATADRRRRERGFAQPGRPQIAKRLRRRVQPNGSQHYASGAWPQIEEAEPWTLSAEQQPQWPFGRGEIYTILNALPRIRTRAPGAAVALVRCLTERAPHPDQETERAREEIGGELGRMLMRIRPTSASVATAARRMAQMQELDTGRSSRKSTKNRLIAECGYWEQVYLLFVQGQSIGHTPGELYDELTRMSRELRGVKSTGRLGFVEAMRADVLLQRGDVREADETMFVAFGLLGKAFPDKELTSLLDSAADPQLAERAKEEVLVIAGHAAGSQERHTGI